MRQVVNIKRSSSGLRGDSRSRQWSTSRSPSSVRCARGCGGVPLGRGRGKASGRKTDTINNAGMHLARAVRTLQLSAWRNMEGMVSGRRKEVGAAVVDYECKGHKNVFKKQKGS